MRFTSLLHAALALACIALQSFSTPAVAGIEIEIDQGNVYSTRGQSWPVIVPPVPLFGQIPFAIDIGSGPQTGLYFIVDQRGSVIFTDSTAVPNLGQIDILRNTVQWTPRDNVTFGVGALDPNWIDPTVAPQYGDFSKHLDAIRFLFLFPVCPSNDLGCSGFSFEATIARLNDAAFVLQFNYGQNIDPISGVTAGFNINGQTASFGGPYSDVGPDYCFVRGVASRFTTIAACQGSVAVVSEPASVPMFFAGLALLVGTQLRGRRRSRARPDETA